MIIIDEKDRPGIRVFILKYILDNGPITDIDLIQKLKEQGYKKLTVADKDFNGSLKKMIGALFKKEYIKRKSHTSPIELTDNSINLFNLATTEALIEMLIYPLPYANELYTELIKLCG